MIIIDERERERGEKDTKNKTWKNRNQVNAKELLFRGEEIDYSKWHFHENQSLGEVARTVHHFVKSTSGKLQFGVAAGDVRNPCHCFLLARGIIKSRRYVGKSERRIGRSGLVEGKTHVWFGGNPESPCFLPGKRLQKIDSGTCKEHSGETDT